MFNTANETPTPEEIVSDFYLAVEVYEGDLNDLRVVQAGLRDTDYGEREQESWRARVPFNEAQLQRSVDQLLLVTNRLRTLAQRTSMPCASLDTLAKSLMYKPYHDLPPNPPTEQQLEQAQDEAELIGAALGVPLPHVSLTANEGAAVDEEAISLLPDNCKIILRAMLTIGAASAESRRKAPEIIRSRDRQDDPENYKRNFAQLVRDGYLRNQKGAVGYWLSAKGKAAAELLRDHP